MARTPAGAKGARNTVRDGVVIRPDGIKLLTQERASAFLGLLRSGETLARDLDAELERDHGIGLRAFEVLLFLAAFSADGCLRMVDLREGTPLSQSRVSRLVAALEAQGFVTRALSDADRRGVEVAITAEGIKKLKEAQDDHIAALERRLFAHLSDDEVDLLAALTARILGARGPASTAGPPDDSPPDSWRRFQSWPVSRR